MTREEERAAFEEIFAAAEAARRSGDYAGAARTYWQAHQIGRYRTATHVRSHFGLLRTALQGGRPMEAAAQSLMVLGSLLVVRRRPEETAPRQGAA